MEFVINGERNEGDILFGFNAGYKTFTMNTTVDDEKGIKFHPKCGGQLASGHLSDLLVADDGINTHSDRVIGTALADGNVIGSNHDDDDIFPLLFQIENDA